MAKARLGAAALQVMAVLGPRHYSERLFTGASAAAFVMLAACTTDGMNSRTARNVTHGAAGGAVGGAAVGAVAPSIGRIEGAAIGAGIGGLAGAVWADNNNDGFADGYYRNGQYYSGEPLGYDPTLRRVATGAVGGAALGAVAGAVIPGLGLLGGAVIGEFVGGVAGATWADRDRDGRVDGFTYNGEYVEGAPRMAGSAYVSADALLASPPAVSVSESVARVIELADAVQYLPVRHSFDRHGPNMVRTRSVRLKDVQVWHAANDALTRTALNAILQECMDGWEEVTAECQAAVRAGSGKFSAVPKNARAEFVKVFQESCPIGGSGETCIEKIQANTLFRSLPRGRLDPRPLKMNEGERTRFVAYIRDQGAVQGGAGLPTDVGFAPDPVALGQLKRVTVIPYSARMCFRLTSEDPAKARIEPERPSDTPIAEPGRVCTEMAEGAGEIKFHPSWWVTPLTGDDLKLNLETEHFVGATRRNFPHEPRPLVIDVVPTPGWWDHADAFIRRLTGTINLAVGLAEALSALFAAVASWALWSWLKPKPSAAKTAT